jgi:signal transduction histidine kinase
VRRWPVARGDAIAAAAVVAATTAVTALPPYGRGLTPIEAALLAVTGIALLRRQRRPIAVFAVTAVSSELFLASYAYHLAALLLGAPLLALYTVAESQDRQRRHLLIGGIAAAALAVAHVISRPDTAIGAGTLALAALGALAVAAGSASRNRRAYLTEVEDRAHRAEQERDMEIARRAAEAARQVTEERLRIARELHDVLGHQLAVINVQSAVAGQSLAESPEQARAALDHVRAASRSALTELRDTIGLLRVAGDCETPTEPAAGVAELEQLYASFRRSGLRIAAAGGAGELPGPVEVTAYRVIQESLTNVYRHAGETDVDVVIEQRPRELRIQVTNRAPDTGPAATPGPAGHGLTGMRERLAALGGHLAATARPDGGFSVVATIPIPPVTA